MMAAEVIVGRVHPLEGLGKSSAAKWTLEDNRKAYRAWAHYAARRKQHKSVKRPLADILIGAFSMRQAGLITRNVDEFRELFPSLKIVDAGR
jgi:predicted nucleic acid-binding protein